MQVREQLSRTGELYYELFFISSDGVGRTGAFICIYSQLEKLKFEETANVFQLVKICRLQRKGLIRHLVSAA